MIPTLQDAVKSVNVVIPSFHRSLGMDLSDPEEAWRCRGSNVNLRAIPSNSARLAVDDIFLYKILRQSAMIPFSNECKGSTGQAALKMP